MELELGLKVIKTRDDITSICEYRFAKDIAGPLFQSKETNTMFILTAHLKGYKSNNIAIKINEDGSKISISGEKPIQEMLMVGWVMLKKEVEITGFSKVFKIPDGVILDRIKAKYDEEEWILKIVMPKLVKGICGARIEEVKEEEYDKGRSELEKTEGDQVLKSIGETSQKGSKDSEVQEIEDRESVMGKKEGGLNEKMLDDANGEIVGESFKRKIEESKLGIEDRNGESVRHKVGEEEYVAMKTLELEQNVGASIPKNIGDTGPDKDFKVQEMEDSESVFEKKETVASDKILDDANGKIIGETSQKEIEKFKLEIKDGNGESVSQKFGKEAYEAVKKSEIEQNVGASIPQKIGDTSQNKESKFQKMKDSESVMEKKEGGIFDKMLDGANREIIGETIQKEVVGPKFGIEDRNGEKVKEKVGKEAYEVMETSELEQNVGDTSQDKEAVHKMEGNESVEKEGGVSDKMLDDANGNIIGDTIQKIIEGSKLGIEDGTVESVKEKVGKAAYEAVKNSEIEKNVGTCIPHNIDTSQDKESEVLQMEDKGSIVEKEKMVTNKKLDDASRNIREMIQKDIEESKLGIEDGDRESVREKDRKVGCIAMKTSELDQNVADHIPSNIAGISHSEIQQKDKTGNVERKMDGGEPKRMPIDAIPKNIFEETIPKDIGKEGFEAMITVREELPKQLPKATLEETEGLNVLKTQETKDVKEAMVKRKGKEIEHFVEKGEGEEPKRMHVETKRLIEKDITKKTRQEEIEKPKNGTQDSDQQNVQKNTVKGGFEVSNRINEELLDEGKGFKVAKMEEPKGVTKEAMAETESLLEKVKGEESKKRIEEASRVIEKSTVTETLQKETVESNIERKARDGPNVSGNIVKGVLGTTQEKLPKQVVETVKAMDQDGNDKIEYGIVKLKGEGSIKMHVEANEVLKEDATGNGIKKDIREPKSSDQLNGQQDMSKGRFEASNAEKEKFPMKMVDSLANKREGLKDTKIEEGKEVKKELIKQKSEKKMEETEDVKDEVAEIEQFAKKVKGEKHEKIQIEANGGLMKDITRVATQKEAEEPKIQTKEKDQQCLQEEMSTGRFEANTTAREFPLQIEDSLAKERNGPKDKEIEEAEEVDKRKIGETKVVESTTKEQIQESENERITHTLQEEMRKGRFEVSTTAREFLHQTEDSLAKKRNEPKDKEIEEAEEVKNEVDKRKIDETKVVESTTKGKSLESENERITQSLQEVPEEKHPKSLDTGTPERELQSAEGPTKCEKVVSMGFKEVEEGIAKDKTQKMVLLPPKNQCKEANESKDDSAEQGILKPKKAKEVEGEKCTYNIESIKAVASIEDQVTKSLSEPRFRSAQQSEVELKGELHKGCKAKYKASLESQKEDPTKDLQNSIEMKDSQESEQMETLKPEIPLEEHLKKKAQVTRQDVFYKGQEHKKTMQEKSEEPKNKIDDRDQQHVQRDVGKGVGIVDTTGKKIPKEEYVADVGPIAVTMETKRDLEATLEREKCITTQNVNDEKPRARVKEELREADIKNVDKAKCIAELQEKGNPRKSEVVEKEAETMGFKEMGPKNEIEEEPQKELSPTTVEMKSKEPLKLENQIMEWKFPKTKELIPESTDREQYGYNTEDIKAPKIAAYQGEKPSQLQSPTLTQQSIDEENRKLENFVEEHEGSKESPKKNTNIDFQESNERMATIENEELETLQPHILETHCLTEKQKVDGNEEKAGECGLQDIYEVETMSPKILIVEENNDKKGCQMTKDVEDELLKREHKAEIGFEKREGPKVAKSEETKEASKQLPKRERGKITQTAEVKNPKMKDIIPEFEQVAEKMHETQRESEIVTSKIGVEITPNKGIEKSHTEDISPLPMEIQSKEPHELSWPNMEHEIPKIEGMTESQVVADKVTKPSKISSSSSSTQPFEDKEDKIAASRDQQCINKDQEESNGMQQIEEEKANEQDSQSQVLEEPKDEANGGEKDGTKRSNKLLVPLVMAGSAILVSFIVIFVRHRKARKSIK